LVVNYPSKESGKGGSRANKVVRIHASLPSRMVRGTRVQVKHVFSSNNNYFTTKSVVIHK
jgi:hypothetical protein